MIITLCGSARFESEFKLWNKLLTIAGHVVFSISVYPSDEGGKKDWYTSVIKNKLDEIHLAKIANSDGIFVINKWGYIGESTLREIRFATNTGKKIYVKESWGEGLCNDRIHKLVKSYKGSPISTVYFPDYTHMDLFGAGMNEIRTECMKILDKYRSKHRESF